MKFLPEIISSFNLGSIQSELKSIGVHSDGLNIMSSKGVFRSIKIKDVNSIAANIIKQEMLSRGGETAVAHGSINLSVKKTDIIIFGTLKQFKELILKLKQHQFGLPELADSIKDALENYDSSPKAIKTKGKNFVFGKCTYVIGILNTTSDSFYDGGKFISTDKAVEHAMEMIQNGADIIDIGGESTRPGAKSITAETEIERVIPVIKKIRKKTKTPISIDTTKAIVARKALLAGADIINDISGLRFDKGMAGVASDFNVPVIVMHIQGNPRTMQRKPTYKNLMSEILDYFEKTIKIAENAGVLRDKIIIDPGIGFGKTVDHNIEILSRLRELKSLGRPILIGTSRKSLIGKTLNLPVGDRLEGTAATVAISVANGADFIRVHDVFQMKRVVKMADAIVRK